MHLAVDCASGAEEARRAQIESEADGTLLGDTIDGIGLDTCDAVGRPDLGYVFRGILESDMPVLSISGELDARTPVGNAEEVLPGLVNGQHFIVDGASHSISRRRCPKSFQLKEGVSASALVSEEGPVQRRTPVYNRAMNLHREETNQNAHI